MNFYTPIIKIAFSVILLIISIGNIQAQTQEKIFDHYSDTLVLLNEIFIDTHKVLLKREQVLAIDSLQVNQRGLKVKSFEFSAITLGNSIQLHSDGAKFTKAMHDEINNSKMNYKFIYIRDIILESEDGRQLEPSIKSIKITFSN